MIFLVMMAISSGHFLKRSQHKYLQEAGLTTIIGMLAGIALRALAIGDTLESIQLHFNNLFMILLLPPIIFESGYNMQKKPFFKNIGSVLAYAFGGTFIAIIFSSFFFYLTGAIGLSYKFDWQQSWAFGSLISATDPVAVLAIFKEMDANENLYAIVFGESIFNDAIGIVMFETVMSLGAEGKTPAQEVASAAGKFVVIFVGSVVIGAMTAFIVAFIIKRQTSYETGSKRDLQRIEEEKKSMR